MLSFLKGRGLFIFSDPGGAKPILALIYLNNIKNYKLVSDRDYDFFLEFNVTVESYKLGQEGFIIDEFKPDYIFTATSYTSKIELKFISEGNKLKLKTYSFIDHYTKFSDRFYFNSQYVFPNKIFVTDQRALYLAKKAGLDKNSQIQISGNFYHEYLIKWKPRISKNNFFSNIGIDNNKTTLLFAPDPLSNIDGKNIFSFDETDIWEDISKALDLIEVANFNFLLKLHPNQNVSYLSKSMIEFPVSNSVIINSKDLNLLIYHSDFIIGMFSSLLVEANVFEKKILRHIPNINATDPLEHLNIGEKSNSIDELARNIKNILIQEK